MLFMWDHDDHDDRENCKSSYFHDQPVTSASTKKWTALCPLSTQEMPCTASRPSGSGALKFEALGRRPHSTSPPSHVNTCHHTGCFPTASPNKDSQPTREQHEQLNLTKLLPKLLTTVKWPFCVLPIEPAGTAQMLLGGRINLGLKLRVRTWFKMIQVSDSMRRSKIRNHQKGHLEISWKFNIPPKNQRWSMLMPSGPSGVNPESQLLDITQLQRKSSDIDPRGWKLLDRSQVSQSLVTSFRCRGNSLFWMASMVASTAGSSSNLGLSRANNRWLPVIAMDLAYTGLACSRLNSRHLKSAQHVLLLAPSIRRTCSLLK